MKKAHTKLTKYFNAANILAKTEIDDNITIITKNVGNEYNYVRKLVKKLEEKGLIKTEETRLKYIRNVNESRGKTKNVTYIDSEIKNEAKRFLEESDNKGLGEEILNSYKNITNLFID